MSERRLKTDRFIQEEDMKTSEGEETYVSGVFEARIFQNGVRMKTTGYSVSGQCIVGKMDKLTEFSTSVIVPPDRLDTVIDLLMDARDFYKSMKT